MTNHKAIADHLARGASPAQAAADLDTTLGDVEQCVRELQTILRVTNLDDVRGRLLQMGYGGATLAPWSASAFSTRPASARTVSAA